MAQKPSSQSASNLRLRGRHLLDHEALTCLLVLLFVDEPRLNTSRLHRVFRNLCYHGPTRAWVIRALLSILQRTGECKPKKKSEPATVPRSVSPSWLSVSLDAALGCRANVFQIQRSERAKKSSPSQLTIHPQASPVVCRHVLDALIPLAKSFPNQFLPRNSKSKEEESKGTTSAAQAASETDFWDLLVKLDHMGSRRGKSIPKTHHNHPTSDAEVLAHTYEESPLGQLMSMLAHPGIRRSQLLTDRLLRLLAIVSWALPETSTSSSAVSTTTTTTTTASTTSGLTSVVTATPACSMATGAPAPAARQSEPQNNDVPRVGETMETSANPGIINGLFHVCN
jgi:E3 ubiquitin-protein ligase HUWE1